MSRRREGSDRRGSDWTCLPCDAKASAAKYAADREARNARRYARKYGLTLDEYRALVARGRCDACGDTGELHVDHCHATGTVRGLLCRDCNHTLGKVKDQPAVLRALADYLERSGAHS